MKGHFCFCILFAGVDNKINAHIFQFSKPKYFENFDLTKMEKKNSVLFVLINFTTFVKIEKIDSYSSKSLNLQKMQKIVFSF